MKILVIGSHGKVGKELVKQLSGKGHEVLAMIRDESQRQEMKALGSSPVIADLELDFEHVFQQVDVVVFTAGSGSKTGPGKTISVDQEGAIQSIDLARKHGVKHYIMVSAQGARDPGRDSPIQHYFKAKRIADDHLVSSGVPYTIFRPGRLHDKEPTGKVLLSKHIPGKGATGRANLAILIAESIGKGSLLNKVLEVFDGEAEIRDALKQV